MKDSTFKQTREKVTLKTDVVCVVDGGWGAWATWSHCSKTCGSGVESRARSCDSPTPSGGGQPCAGDTTETRTCNLGICASKINIYPFIQCMGKIIFSMKYPN